jgi:hypothetical protein
VTPRHFAEAVVTLARTFGFRGAARRARFEARRRLNRLKQRPSQVVLDLQPDAISQSSPFRPDAARIRDVADRSVALSRAERVLAGEFQRYRWTWVKRPTEVRDWMRHPSSGYEYSREMPWYRIAHLDPRAGDIKDVWDPARFGWAFDLARGWMLTGNEMYASSFCEAVDTFLESSPPYLGVHWSCGQETAIRAMAWLWCEAAFDNAAVFTPDRRQRLREALVWSAERIDDAIDYAISQRNNHGVSEATGLIALGARLTGLDPRARRWIRRGASCLRALIRDQFAPDGWYIQHSFWYTRLALDQLVIARRVLRSVRLDLPDDCLRRVRAAVGLLASCVDPHTGQAPNHGANDGSFVLPLTTRPYDDFRSSLTAAAATFGAPLPAVMAVDHEVLAWLSERAPAQSSPTILPRVISGPSGWAVAETADARVFTRAASYRNRPGHIDPAHVDIWLHGSRQAVDAGTFRYLAPPPWRNGLVEIEVHNTLSIDGLPAAQRGPRFLWLRWPDARIISSEIRAPDHVRIVMENRSWRRAGITHLRSCHVRAGSVIVVDELKVPVDFDRTVRVQWLLEDGAAVTMWSASDASIIEQTGVEASTLGWISDGYGDRRSARSIRLEARPSAGHLRVVSAFGDATRTLDSSLREGSMLTSAS